MDANLKAQWLDALRSGKYRQGEGALRGDGAYCCLGVLCDIVGPDRWDDTDCWHAGMTADADADESAYILPLSFARSVFGSGSSGNPNQDGEMNFASRTAGVEDDWMTTLSGVNDSGFTFDQIADLIENQF